MKLLVCGGAGFIGSNFIRYISHRYPAYTVVNYDKLTYAGNLENLQDIERLQTYSFVEGDITDEKKIREVIKKNEITHVINFAAETHVDRSILDPSIFVKTNVLGTYTLLEVCKEFGLRYHHVSTDEVFGALSPTDLPFNEHTPYDPRSPYSASKAGSDHLVRAYFHTYNLPVTISNCSNNYGPFMFPEKIIPLFISNLLENKKVPVYGDGEQVRDWIHVDDHCAGIDRIIHQGKTGETYCLGGDCEVTNLTLTKKILALLSKDESMIEWVKDRPGHDRRYAIDFSKATHELGWRPLIKLDQGLKDVVAWYVSHQDWLERCKNGAYKTYYKRVYGDPIS